MPTWRKTLPPDGKHQGFSLKRTPTTGALQGIITCERLFVCDTHYWHGRTMPCERVTNESGETIDDSGCNACQQKQPYRTHVYVSAFDGKNRTHFLFECTANAAKPLQEYFEATATLRGCIFHSSRAKAAANSKVIIETNTANLARVQLPNAPDIPTALAVIWRLPLSAIVAQEEANRDIVDGQGYATNQSVLRTKTGELKKVREQDDDAGGEIAFMQRREELVKNLLESGGNNGSH